MEHKSKNIEISEIKCSSLVEAVERKSIFVPNFQRQYVWSKKKIVEFLNSQLNQEPFGTILLWSPKTRIPGIETRNKIVEFISSNGTDSNDQKYLIDGQQRITSLLLILNSTKIHKNFVKQDNKPIGWNLGVLISFNYIKNEFTLEKHDDNTITLDDLFQKGNDRKKITSLLEKNKPILNRDQILEYFDIITAARTTITSLPISVIKLVNHNLDEVIEIFSNINTKGAKLTNFDIIHAKWSNLNDGTGLKFNFENKLENSITSFDFGYEKIDKEIFVDSLYLNINDKPLYTSEDKLEFPINEEDSNELIKKFDETLLAFEKTFKFLKGWDMKYNYLPSKIIFKWLTYFYVKTRNKTPGIELDIIKNYVKLSCINDRYRSSSIEMLKKDIKFVNEILLSKNIKDEWEKWKKKSKKEYFEKWELKLENLENITYKTNSEISNYIKFLLISTTKSFIQGISHLTDDNIDMHHIFPSKSEIISKMNEERGEKVEVDNIANTTPLTSIENKIIGKKNPSKYLLELLKDKATTEWEQILETHGIKKEHLESDDFDEFIKYRSEFILKKVNDSHN